MADEITGGERAAAPERSERSERPERSERSGRPDRPQGGGGRGRFQRRRVCAFCVDKIERIDYKDIDMLRRFVSDQGQIDSRRRTGTCARHQRRLTLAIKRARFLALLPYTAEHIRQLA
jgi:small subunit ribosomal protein S18